MAAQTQILWCVYVFVRGGPAPTATNLQWTTTGLWPVLRWILYISSCMEMMAWGLLHWPRTSQFTIWKCTTDREFSLSCEGKNHKKNCVDHAHALGHAGIYTHASCTMRAFNIPWDCQRLLALVVCNGHSELCLVQVLRCILQTLQILDRANTVRKLSAIYNSTHKITTF